MPLPTELHMPSLAQLPQNRETLMLSIAICRGGPRDDILRRHFVNLVRLVDLSVTEYEAARTRLEASLPHADNRLGAYLSAVDHLELCVITVRRALNALACVVHHQEAPAIDRQAHRALKAFGGQLQHTRNAVVHIENEISRGDVRQGEAHALAVSADGRTASIARYTLSLEGLGTAIGRLHELARRLAEYREADGGLQRG